MRWSILAALGWILGATSLLSQAPTPPTRTGTFLEVLLRHEGERPQRKPMVLTADETRFSEEAARYCGKCASEGRLLDETYLVGEEGGIRDVAVVLPKVPGVERTPTKVLLDNSACRFSPRVQFVPVGTPIIITNSDPLMHTARFGPTTGPTVWNGLIAPETEVTGPTLLRAGTFAVTCDAHPWMKAWVIASRAAHRGVTDDRGSLVFGPLTVRGPVEILAWHPELGKAQARAEVVSDQTVRIQLSQKDFRK